MIWCTESCLMDELISSDHTRREVDELILSDHTRREAASREIPMISAHPLDVIPSAKCYYSNIKYVCIPLRKSRWSRDTHDSFDPSIFNDSSKTYYRRTAHQDNLIFWETYATLQTSMFSYEGSRLNRDSDFRSCTCSLFLMGSLYRFY